MTSGIKLTVLTHHATEVSRVLVSLSVPRQSPGAPLYPPASFHPVVYIGTFIGVTCLVTAILSYVTCFTCISLPLNMKHALIHTWLCMSGFTLLFALGSRLTRVEITCQWIGVGLHYLALCTLFWMTVTVK